MHTGKRHRRISHLIVGCLIAFCLVGLNSIAAQDEGSKGLKPEEAGIKTNPKRKKRSRPLTFRTPKLFTLQSAPAGTEYAQVGITIWRVNSGNSKGLEQVGAEQTQERLNTNAPYANGDTIRLSIVSPSGGYLYIVDQEQYSDDSYSPAVLAFPTKTIRGGNNMIQAWEPVQIPAYPSVWRFKSRTLKKGKVQKVQTAEVLTVIISPKPLVDLSRISEKQLVLNEGEFKHWQDQWQWKTTSQQFDMENSVGQVVKARSKSVEQEGAEAPSEEELDAQTSYLVAVKPGAPIMVTVPLRFRSDTNPAQAPK
jgi:hypothetical protein